MDLEEHPVINPNRAHAESLSRLERFAVFITERVGSMGFFFLIATWTTFWLLWNFLAPPSMRFDPPMAFVFWLFISNMIQLLLMPLILVGQNLQARHAEFRADHAYGATMRSLRILQRIERRLDELDHSFRSGKHSTDI